MEQLFSPAIEYHALAARTAFSSYLELIKPRIGVLVTLVTAIVFYLADPHISSYSLLFLTLFGTVLSCSGSAVLNNYIEREIDKEMHRTRRRPLPCGEIPPAHALCFGVLLVIGGTGLLAWQVNLLCGFLALLTAFLYVVVYTPLKRLTWLNTSIGAIPGALPALGAWAAATGELPIQAWLLFLIMFVWQHPHFYSIAWIYRDDYRRGGFHMLPALDHDDGRATFRHILFFSVLLVPVSLLPAFTGMTGNAYAAGAFVLSASLLFLGMSLSRSRSLPDARKLFKASVVYLPALFLLIVADMGL